MDVRDFMETDPLLPILHPGLKSGVMWERESAALARISKRLLEQMEGREKALSRVIFNSAFGGV